MEKNSFDICRFRKFLQINVPNELLSLLIALKKSSKSQKQDNEFEFDFLDWFFMEKEFSLKNVTWLINRKFLHECYLLIQILRIFQVFSKSFLPNINDQKYMFENLCKIKKKVKESLLPQLCREKSEKVREFFLKTNESYILLISLISTPDFFEKLILFEEDYLVDFLKLKSLKNLSPLKVLVRFFSK